MTALNPDMLLATLLAQAEGRCLDVVSLRALVEEASQAGARRALASLGLDDERARRDMDELRELLSAWRDAKRTARRAVVSWLVRIALAAVLASYQLTFESGEQMLGQFLVTRLEYAGDFNGERNYTLALESSGEVVSA